MKIAMLGQKTFPSRDGGVERVAMALGPLFVEGGHEVTALNRRGEHVQNQYSAGIKNGEYKGVRIKEVPSGKRGGLSAVIASIGASALAASGDYDIAHYHAEGYCTMMWLPKLFGKTCVATVHGLDWKREKWGSGLGAKYIRLGEKALVKMADGIIVLSRNMQQYFLDTYGRETVYIPNGVDAPTVREPDIILQKYGLTKGSYFCTVARLTREKGIHVLIEAFQKANTGKKLVIAGAPSHSEEYVRELKTLAAENKDIIFTGFVEGAELEEIYSNAYAFILASSLEGMPLSLLEAMSYGCCVVASDIPEIREAAGGHAIMFPAGDAHALAVELKALANDPALARKSCEGTAVYALREYPWQKTAERTLAFYRACLKKKKKKRKRRRKACGY